MATTGRVSVWVSFFAGHHHSQGIPQQRDSGPTDVHTALTAHARAGHLHHVRPASAAQLPQPIPVRRT